PPAAEAEDPVTTDRGPTGEERVDAIYEARSDGADGFREMNSCSRKKGDRPMTTSLQKSAAVGSLDVVPVAGRIGAEIRDVRLSADLDATTAEGIRQALGRHKVLFFRGQHHLGDASHEALTTLFGGSPVAHPTV